MKFKRNLRRTLHSALGRTIAFLTRLQRWVAPTDVESAEDEDDGFEPLTAEQHAVIRRAEPKGRGRVIATLLPDDGTADARLPSGIIDLERESADPIQPPNAEPDKTTAALKAQADQRAEHLGNVLIGGIAIVMSVCFVVAVLAILFMK